MASLSMLQDSLDDCIEQEYIMPTFFRVNAWSIYAI